MKVSTSLARFNQVLDTWEQALGSYTDAEFLTKPDADAWSIGQVYMHLAGSTNYFHLKHVADCRASDDNANGSMTMPGRISFYVFGGFPPIKIKVPPSPEYTPPQPESVAAVREKLTALRPRMAEMAAKLLEKDNKSGKTKHPAFGYLNAYEWFEMIDMHWRHHLRQKRRLDKFLGK